MEIWVKKENGEKELFDPQKVRTALDRTGLGKKDTERILEQITERLHDGITTQQIYSIVYKKLDELRPEISYRYNLKRALLEIGPGGYEFEDFMATLLNMEGYQTTLRQVLVGKCVSHEIDIIAEKNKERYMTECKFYNTPGHRCRIQTALYVYARYLDLIAGAKKGNCPEFTKPWLITNSKFSDDVKRYANCMEIPLLGWRYPINYGLEAMIDQNKCYPVTVIKMRKDIERKLLKKKIVTIFDMPESASELSEKAGIPLKDAKDIVERAAYAR